MSGDSKNIKEPIFLKKFDQSKWSSAIAKTLVENISLILVNIAISLFIQNMANWKISICIGLPSVAIYVTAVVLYDMLYKFRKNRYQSEQEKMDELQEKLAIEKKRGQSCEEILLSMKAIMDITAKNINALSHKIKEEQIVNEELWSFRQTCTIICRESYNALKTMYGDHNFEVSYIDIYRTSKELKLTLSSYENRDKEKPSIYEKEIVLPKKVKKASMHQKYCFEKIIHEGKNEPICYPTEEVIKENFFFKDLEAKENCKYKQYIAIPVFCESKKAIGLMQIVSLDANVMGDENNLEYLARTLFKPLAYLSLLTHKTEKCIDTLVEVKNNAY